MNADGHVRPPPENFVDFTPPSEASDNDTAETPCSGSLVSPRKWLMQEIYHAEDTTPRRRSARLAQTATPVRPLNLRITVPQVEEAVGETDTSNDATEINQDVEDEPSQLLAERVLSAVSNPSPPPDFLSFPESRLHTPPPEQPGSQTQSNDTSATATPPNPLTRLSLNDEGPESALADPENHAPTPHTFGFSSQSFGSPRQHALSVGKLPVSESSSSDPPSLVSTAISLVDPLAHPQTDQYDLAIIASEKGKGRGIVDDETRDQVVELPTLSESPAKHTGRRRSARRSASPVKRKSTSPDRNLIQPPPRRSTRPSVSPRQTPPPDPTLVLPQTSPLRLPIKNARTQPDASEAGPSPMTGGVGERLREAEMEETKERAGRKRKRQDNANNAVGRKRLGSLSPDSQSVLQQLLPPSRSGSEEDDKAKATKSHQSLFGPQRIPVNRPPVLPDLAHIQTTEPQPHLGTPLRRVLVPTSTVLEDSATARQLGPHLPKMRPLDDPNRSPARRVPTMGHKPFNVKSVAPQPAVFSRQSSALGSTSTLLPNSRPDTKQRSLSEEPTFSRQASSEANHRTPLPYPLTQKHPVIPEECGETQLPALPNGRASSEPPAVSFSSIPRSTLRQPTTPSRIPRVSAKPYSRPTGVQASRLPVLAPTKRAVPNPAKPWNRSDGARSALPSQSKHEPFVPVSSRKAAGPNSETSTKPPVKPHLPVKRLAKLPAVGENPQPSHIPIKSPPRPPHLALPDLQPPTTPVSQAGPPNPEQEQNIIPDLPTTSPEDQLAPETASFSQSRSRGTTEEEDASTARRTTRSKRGPSALLEEATFGSTSVSPSRPPPKKRLPPDSSGFAGLSITALKNLTTDNTAKNQKVASLLETEIVRREGNRPESPAVKLRTIAEKAQEEKAKQREERAQRRAKRSDGGELEPPDVNDLALEEDGRHRRGAGDEEDYETPGRPMQSSKRVQWDRLLFTSVFIDEIPEKLPRPPDRELGKGCLSHTAKSLELDRLGNVQDGGLPLPQLPVEKVVVKRYVYDDDPPPEQETSREPETPPVKNTRSKGRKK